MTRELINIYNRIIYCVIIVLLSVSSYAQYSSIVTNEVKEESLFENKTELNKLLYPENLRSFFEKLEVLEQNNENKINIVHIGDSHIQADLLTGEIRRLLQNRFGNAGLGFSFPYKLAKTNGNHYVQYRSNVEWSAYRNVFPVKDLLIGLSGISLSTTNKNFAVELNVHDSSYKFNRIKLFTPNNARIFDVALTDKKIIIPKTQSKINTHRVAKGESLSTISKRYKVGINQIKQINNLKSNLIRVGATLKIPVNISVAQPISSQDFTPLNMKDKGLYYEFDSQKDLDKVFIIPHQEDNVYSLNGLSLENLNPGILYHSIGVNGAKFSDYNKYDLFFEQIQGLEPDLLVISMGTNESFDKLETAEMQEQVDLFIANVKKNMPNVEIILTTPLPSLLPKKQPNYLAESYADFILNKAESSNYAVWDTFRILGGNEKVGSNFEKGLISRDFVHYSKIGYQYTGELFFKALMQAYSNYKSIHAK